MGIDRRAPNSSATRPWFAVSLPRLAALLEADGKVARRYTDWPMSLKIVAQMPVILECCLDLILFVVQDVFVAARNFVCSADQRR